MGKFVIISILMFVTNTNADAQTFMQHLQEKGQGQGNVTVTQSKAIDELVNGDAAKTAKPHEPAGKNATREKEKTTGKQPEALSKETTANAEHQTHESKTESPAVDTRKKVMRRSYKVDGYRVQVYAGGNSRTDKIKAQQAGNNVKQAFPDQPVYVHFYSPRWICRMGNFRSYEEANNVLRQIQKLGYKEACVVSGKIAVPY